MTDDYETLRRILDSAYDQAANGKGKERHANDKPFDKQPILEITRMLQGTAGPLFQAMKKSQEANGMALRGETDKAIHELRGAIVYTAAAIAYLEESKAKSSDDCGTPLGGPTPGSINEVTGLSREMEPPRIGSVWIHKKSGGLCVVHEVTPNRVRIRGLKDRKRSGSIKTSIETFLMAFEPWSSAKVDLEFPMIGSFYRHKLSKRVYQVVSYIPGDNDRTYMELENPSDSLDSSRVLTEVLESDFEFVDRYDMPEAQNA